MKSKLCSKCNKKSNLECGHSRTPLTESFDQYGFGREKSENSDTLTTFTGTDFYNNASNKYRFG